MGYALSSRFGIHRFAITYIGHRQQLIGKPPELWGDRGALKFPHGATFTQYNHSSLSPGLWSGFYREEANDCENVRLSPWHLFGGLQSTRRSTGRGRFEFDRGTILVGIIGTLCCFIPL